MIESWSDLLAYVRADLGRYRGSRIRTLLMEPQVRWQIRLRVTEWWCNTRGGPVGVFLKWRLANRGAQIGYCIPINTIGRGLRLPHVGTIAVNGYCHVGEYCQLLPGVILGGGPTLGDHVFVGAGAQVIGRVHVGDGAVVAAGAVVVTDVPAGETWGSPKAQRLHARPVQQGEERLSS